MLKQYCLEGILAKESSPRTKDFLLWSDLQISNMLSIQKLHYQWTTNKWKVMFSLFSSTRTRNSVFVVFNWLVRRLSMIYFILITCGDDCCETAGKDIHYVDYDNFLSRITICTEGCWIQKNKKTWLSYDWFNLSFISFLFNFQ